MFVTETWCQSNNKRPSVTKIWHWNTVINFCHRNTMPSLFKILINLHGNIPTQIKKNHNIYNWEVTMQGPLFLHAAMHGGSVARAARPPLVMWQAVMQWWATRVPSAIHALSHHHSMPSFLPHPCHRSHPHCYLNHFQLWILCDKDKFIVVLWAFATKISVT